jgi:hypothetical protein
MPDGMRRDEIYYARAFTSKTSISLTVKYRDPVNTVSPAISVSFVYVVPKFEQVLVGV